MADRLDNYFLDSSFFHKKATWQGSWVYDATNGQIHRGHNHIDIIPKIENGWDKAQQGNIICGWGYPGADYTNYEPTVDIITDTVDPEYASYENPHAKKAMEAAIQHYKDFPDLPPFQHESADYGDKLHKWIYGNGEVHFGPRVNDMDDPPYHSNLVFSHFGTPPDDIACGYYWPIDNSVHMYSRADKAPARETLNAIIPQEALAQGLTDQPHEAGFYTPRYTDSFLDDPYEQPNSIPFYYDKGTFYSKPGAYYHYEFAHELPFAHTEQGDVVGPGPIMGRYDPDTNMYNTYDPDSHENPELAIALEQKYGPKSDFYKAYWNKSSGLYDPWIETSDGVRHTGPTHIEILNKIQNRYEPEDVVRFGGGDAAPIWNIRFEQFMKERAREHQAGAYPTDWTHKWIWADGKMDHCDAQLGQPNYSHHESMLHEMGYNAYTGQPENYIGGLYNANTGDYSSHGYWGRVPSEEELKAELAQRTSPKNHEASDRYTGPPASVVHIPTGDMGEPLGRIPGIYDSNTNTFYHGDRGGSHYPLVDHLRQPETDDDYLDDTVDYWDYMGDHMIPTIYFPVDSDYNGRLDWAQRIKPELQRQFMDAMERHVSNPTHEAYMLGRVRKHSWWEASWIYDATDGEVYHGYDHIEIIKEIPDYEKKAAEGQLVCGWYTTGDDPGVPPDHEGIGAPIRTDTVSGTLADKNSPHAQKAIQAAIADWHNSPEHFEVE